MENKKIVTICREIYSGGKEIGRKLADNLSIKFYDKEILAIAAKESGYMEEMFERADEQPVKSILYSFLGPSSNTPFLGVNDFLTNDKLFAVQCKVIKEIGERESAVIVGRCCDYILKEKSNVCRVFLRADKECRIKRLKLEKPNIDNKKAEHLLNKIDKKRGNYYSYYTGNEWRDIENYDIILNTSKIGIDGAVKQIEDFLTNMK